MDYVIFGCRFRGLKKILEIPEDFISEERTLSRLYNLFKTLFPKNREIRLILIKHRLLQKWRLVWACKYPYSPSSSDMRRMRMLANFMGVLDKTLTDRENNTYIKLLKIGEGLVLIVPNIKDELIDEILPNLASRLITPSNP